MTEEKWTIRTATGNDLSFIYATWLNSYRSDSSIGGSCRKTIYFDNYSRVIDQILSEGDTVVSLAVASDNMDVIYGYAIYQPNTLHYVFVKDAFRNWGIAKSLLAPVVKSITSYTHRTRCVTSYLADKDSLNYNPFKLFKKSPINKGDDDVKSAS